MPLLSICGFYGRVSRRVPLSSVWVIIAGEIMITEEERFKVMVEAAIARVERIIEERVEHRTALIKMELGSHINILENDVRMLKEWKNEYDKEIKRKGN